MYQLLTLLLVGSLNNPVSALSAKATCYFPNGNIATGNYPCFLGQSDSPCCAGGFICEASGLCKVARSNGVSELIRGACTDSTWTSSSCPNYCTDADTGGTNVISCLNATRSNLDFCCDHTNGCCDSGIGRFQVTLNSDELTLGTAGATVSTIAYQPTSSSQITSASSSLTSSSSSSIAANSVTNTAGSAPSASTATSIGNPQLSTGAKAGIGIGAAIGGLAIIGGAVYLCLRKRRRSNILTDSSAPHFSERGMAEVDGGSRSQELEAQSAKMSRLPELEAQSARHGGSRQLYELSG